MKKIRAFSLAELMIVMLVLTIILAATMPILSKRAKVKAAANATVSLPLKNEGDTCTAGAIAIGSDGSLLTCQGGTFKKPPSSDATSVLYLFSNNTYAAPPACSTLTGGWSDGGNGAYFYYPSGATNQVRTCYNTTKTCSTLYLYGTLGGIPPACSTLTGGWSDGGYGIKFAAQDTVVHYVFVRSCYKCN